MKALVESWKSEVSEAIKKLLEAEMEKEEFSFEKSRMKRTNRRIREIRSDERARREGRRDK